MFDNEVRQLSELPCTALNILVMTGSRCGGDEDTM